VPLRIVRDKQERTLNVTVEELDLESESPTGRGRGGQDRDPEPDPETSRGFGITLDNVTADIQRRLRLNDTRGAVITNVEQGSPAARALLQPGDVIVRVGNVPINNVSDAVRELQRVPSGGTALMRVLRTSAAGAEEIFVTPRKD
jgi:C-terminal processing protease CtpA/Prc